MGWLKQETAYERKIRELEEEADRIRKNMQSIMKNVDRSAVHVRSPSSTSSRDQSAGWPVDRRRQSAPPSPGTNTFETPPDADEPELDLESDSQQVREVATEENIPAYGPTRLRQMEAKPEKLANYLASGSFGKRGSLTRERRLQRNKAIFMLIFALLAVFSLISWFK